MVDFLSTQPQAVFGLYIFILSIKVRVKEGRIKNRYYIVFIFFQFYKNRNSHEHAIQTFLEV